MQHTGSSALSPWHQACTCASATSWTLFVPFRNHGGACMVKACLQLCPLGAPLTTSAQLMSAMTSALPAQIHPDVLQETVDVVHISCACLTASLQQ